MTNIRTLLAENMKKYRKIQNISQEKLAEKANSATNYIAMIENCKKFPSPEMLERIARALNVDTAELFTTNPVTIVPYCNKSIERLNQTFQFRKPSEAAWASPNRLCTNRKSADF